MRIETASEITPSLLPPIEREDLESLGISKQSSPSSLLHLLGLATLSICLGGCGQKIEDSHITKASPKDTPDKREVASDEPFITTPDFRPSVEILHIPQVHASPDGDFSRKKIEMVSRWQFEIAKKILAQLKAHPTTLLFSEGLLTPVTTDEILQSSVNTAISTFTSQITTNEGEFITLNPASEDPGLKQYSSQFYTKLKALSRLVEHQGQMYSVVTEDDIRSVIRNSQLTVLGLQNGFPATYEEAKSELKEELYRGAVELLVATGLITKVYPVEKQETIKKILEIRNSSDRITLEGNNTKHSFGPVAADFGTLLFRDATAAELIVRQREADVAELVHSHLVTLSDQRSEKVIIVYGLAHDLSDDFKEYPQFRSDTDLQGKMIDLFSTASDAVQKP